MRLALAIALASCVQTERAPAPALLGAPPRPAACRTVGPSEPLQAVLEDPAAGDVCLMPGRHRGPLRIERAMVLWGPRSAIVSAPRGSAIVVTGAGAVVAGLTIDGTGGSFDSLDAAVKVTGRDIRIEGIAIENAVYGVLVERSSRVRVIGNHVRGSRDPALGLRGDTIRVWETTDSEIAGNVVEDGRDVVVWYARRNRIAGNRIQGGRYGAHLMYSHDNIVEGNELRGGVVGVFAMYSRGVVVRENTIVDAAGVAGMAIGLKESGNISVERNLIARDTVGIYIDASPLQLGDSVAIRSNELLGLRTAIVFHASGRGVEIARNDLAGNDHQVRVDGGGTAIDVAWTDNYWDDYTGYDLDGDGLGDVPHELRSASADLIQRRPAAALFRGTPALAAVDAVSHLDPLFASVTLLVDRRPRMSRTNAHPRVAVR